MLKDNTQAKMEILLPNHKNGFSDWSTYEVDSKINDYYMKLHRRGNYFMFETSFDNKLWSVLRIFSIKSQ